MEVLDAGLSVDEVSVVLGIEDSLVDVFSLRGDDRIVAGPEADRKEFYAGSVWSPDQVRTLVATVALYSALPVLRMYSASPRSCNH